MAKEYKHGDEESVEKKKTFSPPSSPYKKSANDTFLESKKLADEKQRQERARKASLEGGVPQNKDLRSPEFDKKVRTARSTGERVGLNGRSASSYADERIRKSRSAEERAPRMGRGDRKVTSGVRRSESGSQGSRVSPSTKTIAQKAALAGIGGGVGRAAEKAVEAAAYGAMNKGAQKVSRRIRARNAKMRRRMALSERSQKPKKKMTGVWFYIMLSLTILKDVLDVVFTFTLILSILSAFTGLIVTFIIMTYLFVNRVSPTTRKVVVFAATVMIEMIPIVGMLPMASINLLMMRYFENSDKAKKYIRKGGRLRPKFA